MDKSIKTLFGLLIVSIIQVLFLELDTASDLYYYLNIQPSDRILRATGELVLNQSNIFGIEKRWFMWPTSKAGFFPKIIYLTLLLSASHLLLVKNLAKLFQLRSRSIALIFLLFNYYFFVIVLNN